MSYTDNPLFDFECYDREQQSRLDKLPVCADCGEAIQADYYYLINNEIICSDCMESSYRKEIDDYIL